MAKKAKATKRILKQGMLENVMRQFDHATDIIDLNPNIRKILEVTNNELVVHFPVRMDNEEVEVFTGTGYSTTMRWGLTRVACDTTRPSISMPPGPWPCG